MYKVRGLGDTASTAFGAGSSIGAPIATVAAAPAVGAALGISASLAAPIIGAAIAGVTLLVTKLIQNSGCGVTCVETSSWANQAEPLLQQNLSAYFSQPVRSESSQAAALQNFDSIWARLQQLCSQPGTGNAGVRCVSDRQSGACTWKQTASSSIPGTPAAGQCWNWFNGYRDPIANDPDVVPDAQIAQASATNSGGLLSSILGSSSPTASGDTVSIPAWAWLGGAAVVAWWVLS